MDYGYSVADYNKETMAKVVGKALPISTKFSIEISSYIKNKSVKQAKDDLTLVSQGKKALPFKKFNRDLSHKIGMGPGRFPKDASLSFIELLDSVEANAQFKGLNASNLVIKHVRATEASRPFRYGRQRRRKAKRTNVEIVVEEQAGKKDDKKPAKESAKPSPKKEAPVKKAAVEPKKETTEKKEAVVKEEPKKESPKAEKPTAPKKEESKSSEKSPAPKKAENTKEPQK